jgi:hypothetical protein
MKTRNAVLTIGFSLFCAVASAQDATLAYPPAPPADTASTLGTDILPKAMKKELYNVGMLRDNIDSTRIRCKGNACDASYDAFDRTMDSFVISLDMLDTEIKDNAPPVVIDAQVEEMNAQLQLAAGYMELTKRAKDARDMVNAMCDIQTDIAHIYNLSH